MRLGMREFLTLPFGRQTYYEMIARLQEALDKNAPEIAFTDLVFSFLPAKAGVGTSTVALNASAAVSRHPDGMPGFCSTKSITCRECYTSTA